MSTAQTLRHLADALDALDAAEASTRDGFTSDHIQNARAEVHEAIKQSVITGDGEN